MKVYNVLVVRVHSVSTALAGNLATENTSTGIIRYCTYAVEYIERGTQSSQLKFAN